MPPKVLTWKQAVTGFFFYSGNKGRIRKFCKKTEGCGVRTGTQRLKTVRKRDK